MHDFLNNKYYFINKLDTNLIEKVDKNTVIIYRNYKSEIPSKAKILNFKNYCRKTQKKFLISNNVKLALNLNLDGVYIPSFNTNKKYLAYSFKKKFIFIGSAHNLKEIRTKEIQKINKIVISSIFKKNKNYLNLNRFNLLCKLTKLDVIALGGITKSNIKKLNLVNCIGFAGISFFE